MVTEAAGAPSYARNAPVSDCAFLRYVRAFVTAASCPPTALSTGATRAVLIGSPVQFSPGRMKVLLTDPLGHACWARRVTVAAGGSTAPRSSASTESACPSVLVAPWKSPLPVQPGVGLPASGPAGHTCFTRSPSRSRPPTSCGSRPVITAASASRAAAVASGAASVPFG